MATKFDFKSLYPTVMHSGDIYELFLGILRYTYLFTKVTSCFENKMWKKNELNCFKLQYEDIDRVYLANIEEDYDFDIIRYKLAARQIYNEKPLYILLTAKCKYGIFNNKYPYKDWGYIYVSFDAQYFLSSILYPNGYYEDKIYMSMKEDGFAVKKPLSEFDHMPPEFHHLPLSSMRSAPSLQFLCHLKIYQERKLLDSAKNVFPKPFYNSVVDIITSLDNYYKMKDKMDYHTPWF
uniref:Uncharacterized protein n=1 Tax=Trachysalambria curvirostris majanivirus TaxID=2984281 RepID=A0A9C7EZ05_9VIRU|nr:MAG: hypothetical protein [Trachysalambria curvirostris majanivirus]